MHSFYGIVHGKTSKLSQDLRVADGQPVEVIVKTIPSQDPWGEGLRRCAGALANEWSSEDDRILEEIHQDRKRDPRREVPE